MHSPIIYATLSDSITAKQLKSNIFTTPQFDNAVLNKVIPESDWVVANTTDDNNWHRGQWNIAELLIEESQHEHSFIDSIDVQDDFIHITLTRDSWAAYRNYLLGVKAELLNIEQRAIQHGIAFNGPDDTLFTYQAQTVMDHADIEFTYDHYHLFTDYGGTRIAVQSDDYRLEVLHFNQFPNWLFRHLGTNDSVTLHIARQFQGDYHY